MVFHRCIFRLLGIFLCLLWAQNSFAQTALEPLNGRDLGQIENGAGLIEKDPFNRLYEPIHAGSFMLYPLLELQSRYSDNVFANDTREEADVITSVKPQLVLQKNRGRHFFELQASAEAQKAAAEDSEDVENYQAAFRANLEARHDLSIPLSLNYKIDHADRGKIRTGEISKTPLRSKTASASGGIVYKPGRLSLSLIGRAASLRLDDNINSLDNALINRKDADRDTYDLSLKTAYQFHPNWTPFLQALYQREDFMRLNASGSDQDKTLLRGLFGVGFDYKGLITGRIGAGLDHRDFEQDTTDDSTDLALDASVTANISHRTSLSADLSRFSVTDNDIVSGLTSSSLGLELKHELSSDLFLIGRGAYTFDEFEGSSREDKAYEGGLSLQYISSPSLRAALEYEHQSRDSTDTGIDFARNVFILRLLGSL